VSGSTRPDPSARLIAMGSPPKEAKAWAETAIRFGVFALRHRPWRRKLMLWLSLGAALQIALGSIVFEGALEQSLLLFSLYWGFCAVVVLLMILLAFYDMLAIRR